MSSTRRQGRQQRARCLTGAVLLGTTLGCEQVAGIDDREVYNGAGGGQGGTTTSSGGGQGGQGGSTSSGGGTGGTGGIAQCPTPTSSWPDSSFYCYENESTCLPGEDGDVQAAAPDYELQKNGQVVLDKVTGLYWMTASHTDTLGISWTDANTHCAAETVDELTNWRVPLLREIVGLADFGRTPLLPQVFPPESEPYWAEEAHDNYYWGMNTNLGVISWWFENGTGGLHVRCVHGDPSTSTFTASQGGATLIDVDLGLEWNLDENGELDWQEALTYCNTLADHGGCWRLPNVKELLTIYKASASPDFPNAFGAQPKGTYWSSTPDPTGSPEAYAVHYSPANAAVGGASLQPTINERWARCVRNPQ